MRGPASDSLWLVLRSMWVREVVSVRTEGGRGILREWPRVEGWHMAYKVENRAIAVYAAAPLHLALIAWHHTWGHRWHWLCWLGFVDPRGEGGFINREGVWTWRLWHHHRMRRARIALIKAGDWRALAVYYNDPGLPAYARDFHPPTWRGYLRFWWSEAPWRWW